MKNVPFVANKKDNIHCANAVFRMVYAYFFGKNLTWKQIDKITKAVQGKATWTFIGEMEFAKKGLTVVNIEPINYRQLYRRGTSYFKEVVGKENMKYYLEKSNIKSVIKYIPEYVKTVRHETRKAKIREILKLLKQGSLVGAEVNSKILNNKPGFDLHFVLLYDFDGKNIIMHDPGFPPVKARKVSLREFDKCFNFPGANSGIVVFSK